MGMKCQESLIPKVSLMLNVTNRVMFFSPVRKERRSVRRIYTRYTTIDTIPHPSVRVRTRVIAIARTLNINTYQ